MKILTDKNNQPIICYHSTTKKFKEFDPSRIGSFGCYHGYGFNFTTQPNTSYGSIVMKAYLCTNKSLKSNQKRITINRLIRLIIECDRGCIDSICEDFGFDTKTNKPDYYDKVEKAAKTINGICESDLDIYATICISSHNTVKNTMNVFKKFGYDSSIEFVDKNPSTVVVFDTSQILLLD